MSNEFWFSDEQWARIDPLLSKKPAWRAPGE